MKKYNILLLVLFHFTFSNAQETFENVTTNAPPTAATACDDNTNYSQPSNARPFSYACVPIWRASHGTPEIGYAGGSTDNHFAMMWSGCWNTGTANIYGEGIYYPCGFFKGLEYQIEFDLSTNGAFNQIFMYVANGMTPGTVSLSVNNTYYNPIIAEKQSVQPISSTNQAILSNFNIPYPSWSHFIYTFTPDKDYTSLWIFPRTNAANYSMLYLDNVDISTCITHKIYLSGNLPLTTIVQNYIIVGGQGGATVQAVPDALTTLKAANSITFLPGFSAPTGSNLVASIAPYNCLYESCPASNIRMGYKDDNKSIEANLQIYPNPTVGKFTIEFDTELSHKPSIFIYDASGKQISSISTLEINSRLYEVDLQGKQAGLYFMRVQTQQGWITKKIVVNE